MNYKLTIYSNRLYREFDLREDMVPVRVGTCTDSNVRLRKGDFFGEFFFDIEREGEMWQIECDGSIYATSDQIQKASLCTFANDQEITICYRETDAEVFRLTISVNYDYESKDYSRWIDLGRVKRLTIGGEETDDVFLRHIDVGRERLLLQREADDWSVEAYPEKNGFKLNGNKCNRKVLLKEHDFFSLGPYFFCYVDEKLYTDRNSDMEVKNVSVGDDSESTSKFVYPHFNKSTRIMRIISEEPIKVLDPPREPSKPNKNIVVQLFPAIGMLAVIILIRGAMNKTGGSFILMSCCSVGIGLVTSIMNIVTSRKDYKEDMAKRNEEYSSYIEKKRKEIEQLREKERKDLNEKIISGTEQLQRVTKFSPRLFERLPEDDDFLTVRLGSGEKDALRKIDYKKKDQVEAMDELAKIPEAISEEYRRIAHVPITLSLRKCNRIGITGSREILYGMLKLLSMDLAVNQYPTDLKLTYLIDEDEKDAFDWIRLLPHVQNEDLGRRNVICDEESKNVLLDFLYKTVLFRTKNATLPHIVVFVYRERGIQTHPIMELLKKGETRGITFIFFNEYEEFLPRECEYIIRMDPKGNGTKINCNDRNTAERFVPECVQDKEIRSVASKLAPVYCDEINLESTLTKNISFFELLDIYEAEDINIERNWSTSEVYKSMAAPLGVKSKEQVVYLDLHEKQHGPHGLVAGTTGSGKSEILQSYILSMALLYHPYDIGFVIIDFKGGGMVNQFKQLPHLIGSITNIDGREIDRSLLSIRAELKKRQELFAKSNVNHIDAYIKLYKQGKTDIPLPHLILIVDEFAELKMDQPEFMKELISASRIGRSLGVHLILATQKPSGVVDPQIWSNSKFKLCLKVQSREDSNEVLKSPLAAEITEPGRAYLQVGNNEIFELFQSAYSGGPASDTVSDSGGFDIARVSFEGKRIPAYTREREKNSDNADTQLESTVKYIDRYCRQAGIERLPYIFTPPLPVVLSYPDSKEPEAKETGLLAYVGLYDDPMNQNQDDMTINVTTGNTIIIGSAQNGKTNLLQTVVRSLVGQYSPAELNLYILDFGSMIFKNYESLNHVGGVVCSSEDEKCKNLFKLLNQEVKNRKVILAKNGVSSFASYKEAGFSELPQIVVLIDNLTAMRELYLMENDFLLPLCRDGLAVGISFVIANAQTTGIGFRYLSNFEQRIVLYCNDNGEYSMVLENCRIRPLDTPGRCLFSKDKQVYEAQTYLAFDGEREVDRVAHILSYVEKLNARFSGQYANAIPEVPDVLTEEIMEKRFHCRTDNGQLALGIDYDAMKPRTAQWRVNNILAIAGKDSLGKKEFVRYIISALLKVQTRVFLSDDMFSTFADIASETEMYSKRIEDIPDFLESIRNALDEAYNLAVAGGDAEIPAVIWLIHNRDIIREISKNKEYLGTYKKFLDNYKGISFGIIFADVENQAISYQSCELLRMLKDNRQMIVFEEISNIKLFDVSMSLSTKYKKPLEKGEAYLLQDNTIMKVKMISS